MQVDHMRLKLARVKAMKHDKPHEECLTDMNSLTDNEVTKLWEKTYGEFDG